MLRKKNNDGLLKWGRGISSAFMLWGLWGCKQEPTVKVYQAPRPVQSVQLNVTDQLKAQTAQLPMPFWQAPEQWQSMPLGDIRKGSWKVEHEGESLDISVTVFPGDVGGDLANINRWRQQIQLPAWTQSDLHQQVVPILVDNIPAIFVELGFQEQAPQVILAVIVPDQDYTWYFKCMGSQALAQQQRSNFDSFINSVDFQ